MNYYSISKYQPVLIKEDAPLAYPGLPNDVSKAYDLINGEGFESPYEAASIFRSAGLHMRMQEELWALMVNNRKQVIGLCVVSIGSASQSLAQPSDVFRTAVILGATAVIVAHNHPSGDPTPSDIDIATTKRLQEAGHVLGVELLDHIILGEHGYTSLKEQGVM